MSARPEPDVVDVVEGEWGPVVPHMVDRSRDRDGWLTLEPLFDADDVPPVRSPFLDLFSGRGPAIPDVSWVPGEAKGERASPTSVGLRHPLGARAVRRLAEAGHPVPDGWRVVQDHSKRGLVLEVAEAAPPTDVLDWLAGAARVLSEVPLTGRWRATLHRRA